MGLRLLAITVLAGFPSGVWLARGQVGPVSARDGVYSNAQALRGKTLYVDHCGSCHGLELNGDVAASLKNDSFLAIGDLGKVFARLRANMPLDSPGTLPERTYIDVLAFLLQQNGYPAGNSDLTSSTMSQIRLFKATPVKTGTLVQIVGCLQHTDNQWRLSTAAEPVAVAEQVPTSSEVAEAQRQPLGTHTVALVNVDARSVQSSGKAVARGLLILAPGGTRLNVTTLTVAAPACP